MAEPRPAPEAGTALSALVGLAALAVGLAFLVLDPVGPTAPAWERALQGGGAALAGLLAILGAGGAVLARLAPRLLEDERGPLHAAVVGLLLWALLAGGLAMAGLLHPGVARALVAVLAAGWLARPPLRLPRPGPLALVIALVVLLPGLLDALAPPVDTDELYQHLALPRQILASSGLVGGPLHPDGSRPQTLHVVFACLLALGGEAAPRLFHLLLTALCLDGVRALGRQWLGAAGAWAPLVLVGSYSFLQTAGLAANDLPTALAVLAALDAALRGMALPLALAAGLALDLKYTAAGAVTGIFLAARLSWRQRVAAGLGALALVAPWWLRNVAEGLHPLFPFLGWDLRPLDPSAPGALGMPFQYLEKYGAGRSPTSFLMLPWNAVITAQVDGFRFLGRVSPLLLALVPGALAALRRPLPRRLALAAAVSALAWAAGPHWLRYLVPALPLVALALAAGVPQGPGPARLARAALALCLLAGLPANLGPLLLRAADRLPAATGHEARAAFLVRHHPPAAAALWANQHLPPDAVVAQLFDWSTALIDRPVLLGSVEDHVPSRAWLLTHGQASLRDLQAAGATHLVVTRTRFLAKLYPFLTEDERSRELEAPVAFLDELLLAQATLIYQDGQTRIYRLEPPTPDAAPDARARP